MAVTYVAGSSAVHTSSTSTLALNKPTGTAQNDILLVIIGTVDETITNPSGWTTLETLANGNAAFGHVAYKVAGASEGSSYSFTLSQSQDDVAGSIVCFRGIDTASPVRDSAGSTSATSPSLTGTQSTDMVVILGGGRPNSSSADNTVAAPNTGGWTAAAGAQSGDSDPSNFPQSTDVAYQINGTTGTFTATGTTNYTTFAVSVKQASNPATDANAGTSSAASTANTSKLSLGVKAEYI